MSKPTPIEVLDMIAQDMEDDVKKFDGAPLDGKTVATIHGNLAAAIQALAKVQKKHMQECPGHGEEQPLV